MFICKGCCKKGEWSPVVSRGTCEVCGKRAVCFDIQIHGGDDETVQAQGEKVKRQPAAKEKKRRSLWDRKVSRQDAVGRA